MFPPFFCLALPARFVFSGLFSALSLADGLLARFGAVELLSQHSSKFAPFGHVLAGDANVRVFLSRARLRVRRAARWAVEVVGPMRLLAKHAKVGAAALDHVDDVLAAGDGVGSPFFWGRQPQNLSQKLRRGAAIASPNDSVIELDGHASLPEMANSKML